MATPKIDSIITEFGRRIAMQVNFSNGALQNYSSKMTAEVYMSYVNRAMMDIFDSAWLKVEGDADAFIKIYPELSKEHEIAMSIDGEQRYVYWDRISPMNHSKIIFSAYDITNNVPVTILDQSYFSHLLKNDLPHYAHSETAPFGVSFGNKFLSFVGDSPTERTYLCLSVITPLRPDTGGLLVQNGTYDSPFDWTVNTRIAELAEKLFKADAQQTS